MQQTLTTTASKTPYKGCCILSFLLTYDGIDSNEYIDWETEVDNIFAKCFKCENRKLRNVTSALTNNVLPRTWNEMKNIMRKTIVDQSFISIYDLRSDVDYIEEEPFVVTNLLEDDLSTLARCVLVLKWRRRSKIKSTMCMRFFFVLMTLLCHD